MKSVVSPEKWGIFAVEPDWKGNQDSRHRKLRGFPKIPKLTCVLRSVPARSGFQAWRATLKNIPASRPTVTVRFGSLSILQ